MLSRLDYESANSFLKMAKREIEKNNTYIVPSKKVNNKKISNSRLTTYDRH